MRSSLLRFVIGLLAGLAIMGLAFWRLDIGEALSALQDVEAGWLLIALPAFGAARILHALRWRLFLLPVARTPVGGMVGLFLVSNMANALLPLRAGDLLRLELTASRYAVPRIELLASVFVLGTLLDWATFVSLLAALLAVSDLPGLSRWAFLAVAVLVALVLFLAWFLSRDPAHQGAWLQRLASPLLSRFFRGFAALQSATLFALAAVLSVGGWLLEALSYGLIGLAFDLDLAAHEYVAVMIAANLVTSIPLAPLGLGVYELGVGALVAAFGEAREEALAFAIASHLLFNCWIMGAGLAAALALGLSRLPMASEGTVENRRYSSSS